MKEKIITQNERKQAEELYHTLANNSPVGVYIVQDGKFQFVNPQFQKYTGFNEEELLGTESLKLVHPEDRERVRESAVKMLKGKRLPPYELRYIVKGGETLWATETVTSIRYKGKRATLGNFMDITERKQAEEALQEEKNKLQSLVGAIEYGLIILDKDYNIVYQREPGGVTFGTHVGEKCYRAIEGRERVCDGCPVEKAFRDGKSHTSEKRMVMPSGEAFFWENTASPIRDAEGRIVSCLEVARDITKRKRAEEALRESKEKLQKMFESVTDGILVIDLNGVITEVNQRAVEMHGYKSKGELFGKSAFKLVAPGDHKKIANNMQQAIKEGITRGMEYTMLKANGTGFPAELSTSVLRDASGIPIGHITTVRDITERKQAEELFTNLANNLLIGVYIIQDGKFVFVNPQFQKDMGYTEDELLGIVSLDTVHPDDRKLAKEESIKRLKGEVNSPYEFRVIKKNGEAKAVIETVVSIQYKGKRAALGSHMDITEHKQAEEELKLRAQILDGATDSIFVLDPEGNFIYVNEAACRTHGYNREEFTKMNIRQVVVPKRVSGIDSDVQEIVKKGHATFESAHLRKDGSIIPMEVHGSYIESGGKTLFLNVIRDITERKQMEEQLKQQMEELHQAKEQFQALVEESPLGVAMIRKDGHYQYVNHKFVKMFGYTLEDIPTGREWVTKAHPDPQYRKEIISAWKEDTKAAEHGERPHRVFIVTCKDGSEKVIYFRSTALGTGDYLIIYEDITERKQMEEQLKQQMEELQVAYQKLQELDKLKDSFLSTVSHELRTPLTSIKSFSEILLNYDEGKETQREFLTIINDESDRLTRLINDFLDLSKIEAGRMQWETAELSLAEVIQTAINATQALAMQMKLRVDTELDSDLPTVWCDKDRLVQVVTNLLSNAIKFTPEGGMIQVKAQMLNGSRPKEDSDRVMVSVSDSGIGIAPKDHQSIFEKFKQVGDTLSGKPKGTGLGLPICREILEHYGGKIWVESELGKGSTFFFSLPITPKPEAKAPQAKKEKAGVAIKGGKTILVVDDEANIRRFLKHELTNEGYHVLEASGGKKAIDLAREHHPDLITLDIMMRDISGLDVTAVLKNDPDTKDIPILIVSIVEEKERAYKLGANDFVTKPFTIKALTDKINRLLQDAQKTILVVDDDKALVKSLKYRLEKKGFSINVAYNGKEALEMVEGHPPDLVLLDIVMPEMDGYEVMKTLKQKPVTTNIPIVVMSGVEINGGKVKALSVGAAEFLNKSSGFDKILKTIEGILYSQSGV